VTASEERMNWQAGQEWLERGPFSEWKKLMNSEKKERQPISRRTQVFEPFRFMTKHDLK